MGRRSYRDPELKSAIGDNYVNDAVGELNLTAATAVAVMTEYKPTREDTLPLLFSQDVLERAAQARDIIEPSSDTGGYEIDSNVILGISFKGAKVPTLMPDAMQFQAGHRTLLNFIEEVRHVHERYEEVKAVLRWLNRNATIGAIRYYWPSALQLCPKSPAFKEMQHVPTRHSTPAGIVAWTPSLKDAAATVAGSLLLPTDAKARSRDTMWLSFGAYTVTRRDNGHQFETDRTTYFL